MERPAIKNAVSYRPAEPRDVETIHRFICDLAEYEKLRHEVVATPQNIARDLFGSDPKAFTIMAECGGRAAGFALCFYNYSTFQGRAGIYIEDIYIRPEFRGCGIGRGFFKILAQKAWAEGCGRIQWWVLDWNSSAIDFYKGMGGEMMKDWTVCRLGPDAIAALAGEGS
jgi:GNAT superfamily N-acetyltransferase